MKDLNSMMDLRWESRQEVALVATPSLGLTGATPGTSGGRKHRRGKQRRWWL